jgi:integrase
MARPSTPWWWKARGRWACTMGGVRHVAPAGIGERDKHAAWDWHKQLLGRNTPVPTGAYTFEMMAEEYAEQRKVASERDGDDPDVLAQLLRKLKYLCATKVRGVPLGDFYITQLTPGHFKALTETWLKLKFKPNYVHYLQVLTKTVLNMATKPTAAREPLVQVSPFYKLPLITQPKTEQRFATRKTAAEWLRFLWRNPNVPRDYVMIQRCLIHTGARPTEVAAAEWGELRLNAGVTSKGHAFGLLERKKWKNAKKHGELRRIFITPRLHRALGRRNLRKPEGEVYIFRTAKGMAWSSNRLTSYSHRIRTEAKAMEVELPYEGPNRITGYLWRHTAASSMAMQGVDIITIATLLGTSADHIYRTYAHLHNHHLVNAAEVLQANRATSENASRRAAMSQGDRDASGDPKPRAQAHYAPAALPRARRQKA